jgi:uncharacterized membrane protein
MFEQMFSNLPIAVGLACCILMLGAVTGTAPVSFVKQQTPAKAVASTTASAGKVPLYDAVLFKPTAVGATADQPIVPATTYMQQRKKGMGLALNAPLGNQPLAEDYTRVLDLN